MEEMERHGVRNELYNKAKAGGVPLGGIRVDIGDELLSTLFTEDGGYWEKVFQIMWYAFVKNVIEGNVKIALFKGLDAFYLPNDKATMLELYLMIPKRWGRRTKFAERMRYEMLSRLEPVVREAVREKCKELSEANAKGLPVKNW